MSTVMIMLMFGLNGIIIFLLITVLFRLGKNQQQELAAHLIGIEKAIERVERTVNDEMAKNRGENNLVARALREEVANTLSKLNESILKRMNENTTVQLTQLETFSQQLQGLTQMNEQKLERMRETVEKQLRVLREENGSKLEEMRKTVDEKLNQTLEKRLGESFKLVSERLEMVHRGLGEMQTLASGVGDLKRVLSNVKTRGIWGEIQLENLLEQILTIEQYAKNVATKPGSNDRVEFAIKLPGRDTEESIVWLPIDAKFPQEDYQRLLEAQDQANAVLAEEAAKALENRIKSEAKDIANKYVCVPHTTEFAILFLPIEGLYAEVLRRPGLCDTIMRNYKVIIAGPTTLSALLNSLQMGFRTLAVEKRSSEVWSLLSVVKTEFGKFGDLLDKTHKKLQEASNSIDVAARKSRTIERKLKNVQELPQEEAVNMLDAANVAEIAAAQEKE
ncbi:MULTISPECIES: DNA recombination protein RmuC [Pelosinus]|uniref:RmuC-domain protein n=1 Tax=Pelosinus fermentans B4 TaxID=1149862 RepID=I9AYE3_9FIRM|nr:RmuC-domain protein [Pelosinus fermentans B4]EIW23849.1 RmuC-domain protein [Pelosinus fermentans A11]OAM94772.1 RmuC-domain protein [Pelosinus fermentans DSM 17108]SDR17218.1 DNA recombination protein RmuC [Pelosinus fermentans]